jgi:hypothetical protein
MTDARSLDLAAISWGILIIAFLLLIIAGKIKIKKELITLAGKPAVNSSIRGN